MYEYYNANALDLLVDDCAIRAISLVQDRTWDDVYEELSDLAQEQGTMMDNVQFVERYLDSLYKRVCRYSKTVGEFMKEFPKGVFLVTMPGHITAIIDGVNYDTFDTTERYMWCAWFVEK